MSLRGPYARSNPVKVHYCTTQIQENYHTDLGCVGYGRYATVLTYLWGNIIEEGKVIKIFF